MNDHVGKPFDLDELVATIQRHVQRPAAPAAAQPVAAPPRPARAPLPPALLAEAQALGIGLEAAVRRLGGRADVWLRTARSFAAELPRQAEDIARQLAAADAVEAGRSLHTLKGMSATLGAARLAEAAALAEHRLAERRQDGNAADASVAEAIQALAGQTAAAMLQLADGLAAGLGLRPVADEAAGAVASDPAALLQRLPTLAALLREHDMAATDCFAELMQVHEAGWAAALRPLSEAMAVLDFDAALAACERLAGQLTQAQAA